MCEHTKSVCYNFLTKKRIKFSRSIIVYDTIKNDTITLK